MTVPVTSIAELHDRMAAIAATLPATDGVACFNRMYQLVTDAVQQQLAAGAFSDQAWVTRLDIDFGNLYLTAVDPSSTPSRAWAALLDRRADTRVAPLQFALAGMNAHINHDLPLAVVSTSTELNTTPDAHHADYDQVNTILASLEPSIRQSFEAGLLQTADQAVPGLQDVVANFDMVKARETAWANAETLWTLPPAMRPVFEQGLDHLVGFAGRGLLVPLLPAGGV